MKPALFCPEVITYLLGVVLEVEVELEQGWIPKLQNERERALTIDEL